MPKSLDVAVERRLFKKLARTVDSNVARMLKGATDLQVANLSIDPATYRCARAFELDYLLVNYLSKWKGLNTGIDTKAVALSSFAAAEEVCKHTNLRLRSRYTSIVDPILHGASRRIAKLLGPLGEWKTHLDGGWGPGATEEFTFPEAYLDRKIADIPFSVTRHAIDEFANAIKADREWCATLLGHIPVGDFSFTRDVFRIVEGSRITTVEKNAKTDRTIAIEPRGNMFLQKAVGNRLRFLLKSVGVDLDNQGLNQQLARDAFAKGLATIDLKAASDSVSLELVYLLFPIEWAMYLDKIRSKAYTFDGKTYTSFHKLSSMGNGFTFEVESLIFWALVASVRELGESRGSERVCAVYGDDLICPQEDAVVLITVLNYCGFTVNSEKSFIEGSFFESCGRHFFEGSEVTPVYQKEVVTCLLSHIRCHNRLSRWILRRQKALVSGPFSEPDLLTVREVSLHRVVNLDKIPVIPLGAEGDDGFVVGLNRLSRLKARVRFDANYGWSVPTVGNVRRARYPAHERALYSYKLRMNDRKLPSLLPWLDKPGGDEGFDGNIESRQADITATRLQWSRRWVFPTSDVALD